MRKELIGVVVSDKSPKLRVVQVERKVRHSFYKKVMNVRKKFYAHDETNASKTGDRVRIQECRPISKLKHWRVLEVFGVTQSAASPA